MKFRAWVILMAAFMLTLSCGRKAGVYRLEGTLRPASADTILVTGLDFRFDRVDTIFVHEDGRFRYQFRPDTVTPLLLLYSNGARDVVFAEKNLSATLVRDSAANYAKVDGGVYDRQILEFYDLTTGMTDTDSILARIDTLINRDPYSEAAVYLLDKYGRQSELVSQRQKVYNMTDHLGGVMLDNPIISVLRTDMQRRQNPANVINTITLRDTLLKQKKMPEIIGEDYLLVCVWASFAEGTHQAMLSIDTITGKLKDKKIRAAGFSIDSSVERWLEAIEQDSTQISQYCDPKGWHGTVAEQLPDGKLPCYLIIAPPGRVVARNHSAEAITKELTVNMIESLPDKEKKDKKKNNKKGK